MTNAEIEENLELVGLLLNDVPKKYQFLDIDKIKLAIKKAQDIIGQLD